MQIKTETNICVTCQTNISLCNNNKKKRLNLSYNRTLHPTKEQYYFFCIPINPLKNHTVLKNLSQNSQSPKPSHLSPNSVYHVPSLTFPPTRPNHAHTHTYLFPWEPAAALSARTHILICDTRALLRAAISREEENWARARGPQSASDIPRAHVCMEWRACYPLTAHGVVLYCEEFRVCAILYRRRRWSTFLNRCVWGCG